MTGVFEYDSNAPVCVDDLISHRFTIDDIKIDITEYNGLYDITKVLKAYGIRYSQFCKIHESHWTELSELLNGPAITKFNQVNPKAKPLRCIREELLVLALQTKKIPSQVCDIVISHIKNIYGRPLKDIKELRFKTLASSDMSVSISISEHKDGWCNLRSLLQSAKVIKGEHGTIAKFLANKSSKDDVNAIIECYFPDHVDKPMVEKINMLYMKQYGVEWIHEDLAIAFAMWISPKFRTQVYGLMRRIHRGDFTVVSDVINIIDEASDTKSQVEIKSWSNKLLQSNPDAKKDYDEKYESLMDQINQLTTMNQNNCTQLNETRIALYNSNQQAEQWRIQLYDTKSSLETIQTLSSVDEQTIDRVLSVTRGAKSISFNDAFDYVRESEGRLRKDMSDLKQENGELKFRISMLEKEIDVLINEKKIAIDAVDDVDYDIKTVMNIYNGTKAYAGHVITYALEHGLKIPVREKDKQFIDSNSLARIESNSIRIRSKLANAANLSDIQLERQFSEYVQSNIKQPPQCTFEFSPSYTKPTTNNGVIFIYCIKHNTKSNYFKWVVHDMGSTYLDRDGYTTILSDAPLGSIDRWGLIYIGSIHTSIKCPMYDIILNIADGVCLEYRFKRADRVGYVAFVTVNHPKAIERAVCVNIKEHFLHKTYKSNTVKKWDSWITEAVPLYVL